MGSQRVGHDWATFTFFHFKLSPHSGGAHLKSWNLEYGYMYVPPTPVPSSTGNFWSHILLWLASTPIAFLLTDHSQACPFPWLGPSYTTKNKTVSGWFLRGDSILLYNLCACSVAQSCLTLCFPGGTVVKNLPANARVARDVCLVPGSGRSPGVENGNPLQYLVWKISWTGEPEVSKRQAWVAEHTHTHVYSSGG